MERLLACGAVRSGLRRGGKADGACDSLPQQVDARVVRDTVDPDLQDEGSGARAGRPAGDGTRVFLR